MFEFIASATILGLAGGFGPGPLLTLVVTETLAHGLGAGIKVAIAPLITDAPIIIVALFVLSRLSGIGWVLGVVSIVGGIVVMKMGYDGLRHGGDQAEEKPEPSRSLRKGAIVNALNPHPYVFWLSVGGPITVRASEMSLPTAVTFVALFYCLLVGSKVVVAWIASKSRPFLRGRTYDTTVRVLGGLLCVFALLLIREGIALIGHGAL